MMLCFLVPSQIQVSDAVPVISSVAFCHSLCIVDTEVWQGVAWARQQGRMRHTGAQSAHHASPVQKSVQGPGGCCCCCCCCVWLYLESCSRVL